MCTTAVVEQARKKLIQFLDSVMAAQTASAFVDASVDTCEASRDLFFASGNLFDPPNGFLDTIEMELSRAAKLIDAQQQRFSLDEADSEIVKVVLTNIAARANELVAEQRAEVQA